MNQNPHTKLICLNKEIQTCREEIDYLESVLVTTTFNAKDIVKSLTIAKERLKDLITEYDATITKTRIFKYDFK